MVGHLGQQRPSGALPCSVQGSDTPLRWSLLLAFSALAFVGSRSSQLRTQTRTGLPRAQKLSTGANGRTYRGYAGLGSIWPRIGLNASPYLGVVQHRSLRSLPAVWGFGLCGAPLACSHPTAEGRTYATSLLPPISDPYRELRRFFTVQSPFLCPCAALAAAFPTSQPALLAFAKPSLQSFWRSPQRGQPCDSLRAVSAAQSL